MMKTSTTNLKFMLLLALISIMPLVNAQLDEIEYEGTYVYWGLMDDGAFGPFPIGFDFDFYGNTYSEFYVTSNGLVMFDTLSTSWTNMTIPWPDNLTDDTVNNYIAPFWDDIMISDYGDIRYATVGASPNNKLIIQFKDMWIFDAPFLLGTFQVILYEGSDVIQIQYRNIPDLSSPESSGSSATIGLENIDGTAGILCSYNTSGFVKSGKAVRFIPGGGTYTFTETTLYDPVILVDSIPEPGVANLVSPAFNSTVGADVTFLWEEASHASRYNVIISQNSDMSVPVHTSADLTSLSYEYTLTSGATYYWRVAATNEADSTTWSDVWTFQTSASPPLTPVPLTFHMEQGAIQAINLMYTGGDLGAKTATITSLPVQGALYQNNGGALGPQITTVPTAVTDAAFGVIYVASGTTGRGVGNFNFHFSDGTGTSSDDSIICNVTPLGVPTFLEVCYESDRVELIFDRNMADPTGMHDQFSVQGNSIGATSTSCSLKEGDSTTIVVYYDPPFDIDITTIEVAYIKGTVTSATGGYLESFTYQQAMKQSQNMTFDPLPDRAYGDPDFTLSASTTFGFPITYRSEDPLIVSISGSTATIQNVGETLIYAIQEGNDSIQPVKYAQLQRVNKAAATVTLSDLSQEYTGSGISATVTTVPPGLNVIVTYNGSETLPIALGTYAVVATVDDPHYAGSASDNLVIGDLTPPVPDVDPLPDLTDECSVTPVAPTATDNMAGTVTGTTTTPFPITAQGTTVITWSYDDGAGNISTQDQNVIIDDVTDPVTPVLPDLTDECSVTAVAPTTTDACAGTVTGTTTDPLTYSTEGTYVITWNFDDGNGNDIDVTQNVIIDDVTDPVTPVLPDLTDECSVTAVAPTTTDNCAGTITGTTTDPLTYSTEGTYVITWNFDDGNGNDIDVTQNVIIDDVTDPVTPVLVDVTGECSATVAVPTTTDNCAGTITATTSDPTTYSTEGTYVITWTFDDGNGNSIDVTQNVIVDDVTDPLTPTLPDLTGECSVTATVPTTTDACAGSVNGTTTDPLTYTALGSYVITWTFDDGNGNSITVDQNVLVTDNTDPLTPVLPDLTGECSVTATVPTTTDACAGIITGTTTDPLSYTDLGAYVITWTFDDGNGNSITVDQNVLVTDNTDPVVPTLADVTGECSVTVLAPTTTDACAGIITGTTTDPLSYTSLGAYVVTWTFDDGNGNSITVDQNVFVTDETDPVVPTLADVTGECMATADIPTTTDACAGVLTGTTTDALTYATVGTHVITWTFDDGNGNRIYVDQNVIVTDDTAPTATVPADVVTCDGTVSSIGLTAVMDNCSTPVASYEITGATTGSGSGYDASGVVFDPGVSTVTYTLDDGNGNTSDYSLTVTYQVVEDIVVTVSGGTLTCENTGSYQWINCADNSILEGETGSTFQPEEDGDYAVILTQNGCSDTSECYSPDYTGIDPERSMEYTLYPNPAHTYITLEMAREQTNVTLKVVDMTGSVIKVEEMDRLIKTDLDISDFKAGVYMIQIISDQVNSVARIMKE